MNRVVIAAFVLMLATVTAAVLLPARERVLAVPQIANESAQEGRPPTPLILQEGDGDHPVHRAGPLAGLPFTIKLDGEFGHSQDSFVFTETLPRGQSIPFHKHHNAEEILIFEEGGAAVMVGDKRAEAGPHSLVFIPRDTWISATKTSGQDLHLFAIFSHLGYERYMRSISVKQGQPVTPLNPEELPKLRALGHAEYWDTSKGPYPPGVAHP
ncbi:MAG TPA: cupin domain-containing protein [Candidatus Sulfotelmatobacter sp.]|nr:cupin domain-containing protein [Candidatus Sulfotelmatobacter sp.]